MERLRLFVLRIPFFGTRKIPSWKQGLALTKKLQKRLVFAVSEALFTTQTPRRETYYPCEGLISRAFNGNYSTFYHNYFIFSKI